jgi:hypothetical protein
VWRVLRFTLVVFVLLFLAPWLTSLAYGNSNGDSVQAEVRVKAAEPSAAPAATIFGKAIGGVTPGDLFYVDATDSPRDMSVSLYITNAHELTPYLRYLILKVAVYYEDEGGQWRETPLREGNQLPDTYITLHNSPVNLTLPGCTRYKISIDSGCFYCLAANTNGNNVSPIFYLTIETV